MSKRPWGEYEDLKHSYGEYKIKILTLEPSKSISLQYHLHRSEIWTVLRGAGQAKINGAKKFILEGDTVVVPLGVIHKLTNVGKIDLVILEAQIGSYCEEDDIVRFPTEVVKPEELPEEKK